MEKQRLETEKQEEIRKLEEEKEEALRQAEENMLTELEKERERQKILKEMTERIAKQNEKSESQLEENRKKLEEDKQRMISMQEKARQEVSDMQKEEEEKLQKELSEKLSEQTMKLKEQQKELEEAERIAKEKEAELLEKQKILDERNRIVAEKIKVDDAVCIPDKPMEDEQVVETDRSKKLLTMWWAKENVAYMKNGEYVNVTFYLFPIEYMRFPKPSAFILVEEYNGDYSTYLVNNPKNITVKVGNIDISLGFLFTKDGNIRVNLNSYTQGVEEIERNEDFQIGMFTPHHFGKVIDTSLGSYQIFPVKENINGTCDAVILSEDNEVMIVKGSAVLDGRTYSFYLSDTEFIAECNA